MPITPFAPEGTHQENHVKHNNVANNRGDGPGKKSGRTEHLIESGESEPVQIQLVPVPTTEIDEKDIMANLNKVVIVGHSVCDPENRVGPSGSPFGFFTIAANYRYTDKNGQRQEEAAFVPCLVFGAAVEWLLEKKEGRFNHRAPEGSARIPGSRTAPGCPG